MTNPTTKLTWSCLVCDDMFETDSASLEHFNTKHCDKDIEVLNNDLKKEKSVSHNKIKSDF